MKPKDYEIANELKKKLSEVTQLIDFRVFGSRARGDEDEYSDMDVFIEIERLDKDMKKKINTVIWEVGFNNSIYISPLIYTRYEIEMSPLRASPIIESIYEDGVTV
jgi:uncharacterized protein